MDGERIKYEIKKRGYTIKRVADELNTSAQNLGAKLQTDDISSGLMEKIAKIIGAKVSDFYSDGDIISAINNSTAFNGNHSCDGRLLDQIDKYQEQIDRLLTIIEKMQKQ